MESRLARKMDQRIILQISAISRAADGSWVPAWIEHDTVWAYKASSNSREYYQAQKVNAELTALFIIRYRSKMTPRMRLIHEGRTFDILGADDPTGKRVEIHLPCKEVI
jgi:SPP1 family predicted phage head-tail adaptor